MINDNPCQGCNFSNKPYWSIINPCTNCPKQFTGEFVTTTTTSMPSVEYTPVRYGRWKHLGGDEWFCTNCGFVISTEGSWDKPVKKYCEECGAKMNLEI